MNKITNKSSAFFSASSNRHELLLQNQRRPPPIKIYKPKPKEEVPKEEVPKEVFAIQETIISGTVGQVFTYKSNSDPLFLRYVQILTVDGVIIEKYTIDYTDACTTQITLGQDIVDCIIRIYFYDPIYMGILEQVESPTDSNIFEWDAVLNWEEWEAEIIKAEIGEPFIGGLYTKKPFTFVYNGYIFSN